MQITKKMWGGEGCVHQNVTEMMSDFRILKPAVLQIQENMKQKKVSQHASWVLAHREITSSCL